MGLGLEVVSGFVTAPDTTFTAWTVAAGNSLTIRNGRDNAQLLLLSAWALNQTAGVLRIRSTRLHDSTQGLRMRVVASEAKPLLPNTFRQKLFPQDALTVEQTGSSTALDIEQGSFLVFYEDLPGAAARLVKASTVLDRMVNILTVENSLTMGTAGGYSGEEAINAEFDLMRANTDYALLGYLVDGELGAVRWRGADTANMGVGGPGDDLGHDYTRSWFIDLARMFDLPLIPVFNSANKAGLLLDGTSDENATTVVVTSIFAELAPGTVAAPAA